MIVEGQKKKANYWGKFVVKKVAKLRQPIECHSDVKGMVLFSPTLVKIDWEKAPSSDKHDLWFPYWITTDGREKYGQFAPMMGERSLLELLESAIDQDFFSKSFLKRLIRAANKKLS